MFTPWSVWKLVSATEYNIENVFVTFYLKIRTKSPSNGSFSIFDSVVETSFHRPVVYIIFIHKKIFFMVVHN